MSPGHVSYLPSGLELVPRLELAPPHCSLSLEEVKDAIRNATHLLICGIASVTTTSDNIVTDDTANGNTTQDVPHRKRVQLVQDEQALLYSDRIIV